MKKVEYTFVIKHVVDVDEYEDKTPPGNIHEMYADFTVGCLEEALKEQEIGGSVSFAGYREIEE